jgi:hypothetical protein
MEISSLFSPPLRRHGLLFIPLKPGSGGAYTNATSDAGRCITYGTILSTDTDGSSNISIEFGLQKSSVHTNEAEFVWTDGQRVALCINVPYRTKSVFSSKSGLFDLQLWSRDMEPIAIFRVTNSDSDVTPSKAKRIRDSQEGNSHIPGLESEIYSHKKAHEKRLMLEQVGNEVSNILHSPNASTPNLCIVYDNRTSPPSRYGDWSYDCERWTVRLD